MTDETKETPAETAKPSQEPTGTLAEEAGKAVNDSPQARLQQELTPDQLKQVERMVGQALDGAKRKWDENAEKELSSKGYVTPEEVEAKVAQAIQVAETRAKAEANVKMWLAEQGIDPASEEASKVFAEYKEGLQAKRYTPEMLLDSKGVGYLVHAAGLAPKASQADSLELPRTSMPIMEIPRNEEGKPLTRQQMDAEIRRKNLEAIQQLR